MPRLLSPRFTFRSLQTWIFAAPVILVIALLLRAALLPDAAARQFQNAQNLQTAGQSERALRLYRIIVEAQPRSPYAPLSLLQQGEILAAMARRGGNASLFREAIAAYERLATEYSSHSSSGEALLAAGNLALNDLRDTKSAARFYKVLLENYEHNADYVSEATLRLGRIALQDGDGKRADEFFARVLKNFARFPERCAEAQYHRGVVLETLLKNRAAARGAYETVVKNWPRSVWAGSAKERLGMMAYSEQNGSRPARRVVLEIGSLPKIEGNSRDAALRLILAARGLEIGDAVWRGWSLAPFRAGFAPDASMRVLESDGSWESVAGAAGIVFSRRNARDSLGALKTLYDELDAGHATLVNISGWVLVCGYDTSRGEILVRRGGAEMETWKVKDFASRWRSGSEYLLLSFHVPGEKIKAEVEKQNTSQNAPALLAPIYSHKLSSLSLRSSHRRALRRASSLMRRSREGGMLLNLEALRALHSAMQKISNAPDSPVPSPETARDEDETSPEEASTPVPESTPIAPRADTTFSSATRWKTLRHWFGAPLAAWIATRRDAAAFLDAAANDLNDASLQRAAQEMRASITALEAAHDVIPAGDAFDSDADAARAAIGNAASEIERALQAETRAVSAMD